MGKLLVLLLALNVPGWQGSLYKEMCNHFINPTYPTSKIEFIDKKTAYFSSVGAFADPENKQKFVVHDLNTMPTWFFNIRYHGRIFNELWHKDIHNGLPCNVFINNDILLHLETAGVVKADIIFKVHFIIIDTKFGTVSIVKSDNSYPSNLVKDFDLIIWTFPNPLVKNLSIVVVQGYLASNRNINFFDNYFKWQLDNILQNFGDRFMIDANGVK